MIPPTLAILLAAIGIVPALVLAAVLRTPFRRVRAEDSAGVHRDARALALVVGAFLAVAALARALGVPERTGSISGLSTFGFLLFAIGMADFVRHRWAPERVRIAWVAFVAGCAMLPLEALLRSPRGGPGPLFAAAIAPTTVLMAAAVLLFRRQVLVDAALRRRYAAELARGLDRRAAAAAVVSSSARAAEHLEDARAEHAPRPGHGPLEARVLALDHLSLRWDVEERLAAAAAAAAATRGNRVAREKAVERAHLEPCAARLVEAGMDPEAAAARAKAWLEAPDVDLVAMTVRTAARSASADADASTDATGNALADPDAPAPPAPLAAEMGRLRHLAAATLVFAIVVAASAVPALRSPRAGMPLVGGGMLVSAFALVLLTIGLRRSSLRLIVNGLVWLVASAVIVSLVTPRALRAPRAPREPHEPHEPRAAPAPTAAPQPTRSGG